MNKDNPYMTGKITTRLKSVSTFLRVRSIILMHCNKEIVIEDYDAVRQYLIDTDLFLHSVLEDLLNNSKDLMEDELRDY